MYFKDLTLHRYSSNLDNSKVLNVGWLDKKYSFIQFEPTEDFLNKLFNLCLTPTRKSLGYHSCPFCKASWGVKVKRNGKNLTLGSAEIRVNGANGIVYAAPNLIYHYVEVHKYQPPKEFIESVLAS